MRKLLALIGVAALVGGSLGAAGPVGAAFPGANGRIVLVTDGPGKTVIASMTDTGADVQFLTQPNQSPTQFGDGNPRWSPGGKFVVFSRYDGSGNGDIWIMNADGSAQKRLNNSATDDDWAGFSADGSRLVFSSNRSGNYEIYSMLLNGAGVVRLTTNAGDDLVPVWSPNNDRIAFASDRRGVFEIFTMSVTGGNVTRETTGVGYGDIEPAWSSDGMSIYFSRVAGDFSQSKIWRVPLAGTEELVPLTGQHQFEPIAPPDPATSPYELIYVLDFAAGSEIFANTEQHLTEFVDGSAYQPDWQPVPAFPLVDARFSTFKTDIEWVFAEGITVGCSPERYCPTDPVTREQMATFLVRALGLTGTPPDAFTDDTGSTHELNINRLAAAGITSGCAPNLFCPTAPVARDQMASFLSRAKGLTGTPPDAFTDDNGNTHELNINRLFAAGITSGCGGTNYCPTQTVTRGQMAAFLHRAFDTP